MNQSNSQGTNEGIKIEYTDYDDKQVCEPEFQQGVPRNNQRKRDAEAYAYRHDENVNEYIPTECSNNGFSWVPGDQLNSSGPVFTTSRRSGAGMAASTSQYHMPDEVWNRSVVINQSTWPAYVENEKLFERQDAYHGGSFYHQFPDNGLEVPSDRYSDNSSDNNIISSQYLGPGTTSTKNLEDEHIKRETSTDGIPFDNWVINQDYMLAEGMISSMSPSPADGEIPNSDVFPRTENVIEYDESARNSTRVISYPHDTNMDFPGFFTYGNTDSRDLSKDLAGSKILKFDASTYYSGNNVKSTCSPNSDNPLLIEQQRYDLEAKSQLRNPSFSSKSSQKQNSRNSVKVPMKLISPELDPQVSSNSFKQTGLGLSPSDVDQQHYTPSPSASSGACASSYEAQSSGVKTFVDSANILWIQFEYPQKSVLTKYTINCDMAGYEKYEYSEEYKLENCIYPNVIHGVESGRTHRSKYEIECNKMAWRLVQLNPHIGKRRGLVQQAVNHYRNYSNDKNTHSRRRAQMLARGKERERQREKEQQGRMTKSRRRKR